jgi:hypothetical protein
MNEQAKDEQVENAWALYVMMDRAFSDLKRAGRWSLFALWLDKVEELVEAKRNYVSAVNAAGMDPYDIAALEEHRFRHTE